MKFSFQFVLNYLGYLLTAFVLFGAGFYFGFKNASVVASTKSDSTNEAVKNIAGAIASSVNRSSNSSASINTISGVFWIKSGQTPICASDYSVKGKFDAPASFYYTKESKTYDRVKPDICFASEEIARDVAGFIRKY